MKRVIQLEDNGQDFLQVVTDDRGEIIETRPFQTDIWKGGFIPLEMVVVGKKLPIHHPPHIKFGFFNHKVEKITNEL